MTAPEIPTPEGSAVMIRTHHSGPRAVLANVGRLVKIAVVTGVLTLVVVDGGSAAITAMSVSDHVKEAGLAAANAAVHQPVTGATAQIAYTAAQQALGDRGGRIVTDGPNGFVLERDGGVTLTLERTAPTLLLHRIGPLRHFGEASATWHQQPSKY